MESKIESKIIKREVQWKGNWIQIEFLDFTVGGKVLKNYESCQRLKKRENQIIDGISIMGIVKSEKQKTRKLLLIAQYRPPTGRFILETPAGLCEGDPSDAKQLWIDMQRELKEETGYTGTKLLSQLDELPISFGDPSILNGSGKIALVEIDGDAEENQNPQQELEESENINVHLVDINENLYENVIKLAKDNNYLLIDKLMGFITGFQCALSFMK